MVGGEIVAFDVRDRSEVARHRIESSTSPPNAQDGAGRAGAGAVPIGMILTADSVSVFAAATALDRIVQLALRAHGRARDRRRG